MGMEVPEHCRGLCKAMSERSELGAGNDIPLKKSKQQLKQLTTPNRRSYSKAEVRSLKQSEAPKTNEGFFCFSCPTAMETSTQHPHEFWHNVFSPFL